MLMCSVCHSAKPEVDFYRNRRTKTGFREECKECFSQYVRQWRAKNRDKVKVYRGKERDLLQRKKRDNPKWWATTIKRRLLRREYGLSLEEYEIMEADGCAICGVKRSKNGRRLSVDHNHATGKVRGLLCNECNFSVGLMRERPELLERAAQYIMVSG